jgi:hypothetical protein
MGKSNRAIVVGVLVLVTVAAPSSIKAWPFVFNVCALLAAITCWNRLSKALKELEPPVGGD